MARLRPWPWPRYIACCETGCRSTPRGSVRGRNCRLQALRRPCTRSTFCRVTLSRPRQGWASSEHVLAAVDGDVGAGDEGGLVGGEVGDESRDLVGRAQPAHRDLRNDLAVEYLLRNGHHHLGTDVAGRDRVDGDAFFR